MGGRGEGGLRPFQDVMKNAIWVVLAGLCGLLCSICSVLTCSSSLLFCASGGLCFVVVAFPGYYYLYFYMAVLKFKV